MRFKCLLLTLLTLIASTPLWAQMDETLHIELESEFEALAASPQCSGGIVYDDGVFSDAYSLGTGNPGDSTMVMKFDLPAGVTALDQICACFTRNGSGPSSMSFEVRVYNDNGGGGQPGTLLGSATATASSIPLFGASAFYSVNTQSAGIVLPDTSVYVGVRWPGGGILLCGDRSAGTAQRTSFGSGNSGSSWTNLANLFPTAPPRALGVRVDAASSGNCTPSSTALCLGGGRFRVQATYEVPGGSAGAAQVVKLTDETGYLWFFSSSNVEAVVKVLNGCGVNGRYWVFAGGLTNVRTVITVTDTQTSAITTYTNPQGTAFQPIQDTSAFATCP